MKSAERGFNRWGCVAGPLPMSRGSCVSVSIWNLTSGDARVRAPRSTLRLRSTLASAFMLRRSCVKGSCILLRSTAPHSTAQAQLKVGTGGEVVVKTQYCKHCVNDMHSGGEV